MVICLKVKTLDSQTYDFSVDNEISVRQFKETIAERTSISADLQRIIYCGRVLADEKLLKEYDVNGKVVHVVERPPPSARSTSNTGHAPNRRQRGDGIEGNIRGAPIFRALDGLVVGAMTIPVNPNGGTPPTAAHLNPSSSFCMNRITVARHMLECANNIASYLENPERGLNNSSLDILTQGRWTMESTVVEVGISAASNVELPQNQTQNIVEALHGAVSAALRQNGHPNVTVLQLPTVFGSNGSTVMTAPQGQELTTDQFLNIISRQPQHENETQNASTPEVVGTPNTTTTGSTNQNQQQQQQSQQSQQPPQPPQPQQPQPQPQQQQERSRIGTPVGGNSNSESPTSGRQRTGTRVLAEVVQQMRAVQTRLEPFYQQYYEILLNDPAFPENDNTGRENAQRIYDRISEALHYLSHAQHAISDLMLDMSQNTPRFLCCRPILVEQSGYVSSNNYLASFLQPNGNNNETTATNNNPMMINLTPPPLINANDNSPLLLNNDSNIIMAGRPFGRMTIPMEPTPQEEQNEQQQQQQQQTNPSNNGQQQQTTESNLDNDIDIPQTPTTTPVQSQIPTTLSGPGGQLTASSQEQQQQQGQSQQHQQQSQPPQLQARNINARNLHRILSPLLMPFDTNTPNNANSDNGQNSANSQLQVARLIQAVVNSAPVDADVHVQINAPNLLFGMPVRTSTPSSIQDGSGTTTSTTTTTTTTLNTSTSQTTNSNANTTNSTANSTASEITDSNQQQPRFTTATHPTTSTQTRSTARPQVHVANLPPSQMWNARVIPANMLSSFDRFLPCSSHHIRDTELSDVNNSGQHNQNIFTRTRNHQMRVQRNNRNQQQPGSIVVNSPGIIIGAPTILTASTTAGPAESSTASTPRSTTTTQPTSSTRSNSSSDDIFNLSTEDFNTPINLFGSNLTLRDLIDITPSPNTLNRIRSELYAFIVENLFAGTEINEENMNNAINQVIQLLNNALVFLPQFDLPDYDARASVENFLRNTLPFIINLIREDDSNEFGTRLLRELINFVRRLFVILITCVGRSNAELYINQIAQMTITSNNALEQEALRALQRHLMAAVIRQLDLTRQNTIEVQEFLVVRRPSPEQSQTTNAITPMETDDIVADEPIESMAISNETSSLQQRNQDQNLPIPAPISDVNEPLPSVVVGSESWHNNFPSTWLPIITRDIERQRRQSPQGSFSDAYISGMSAKRRKLITNSKPPTDVTSLLSDGVRIALQTVNGSSNSAIGGGIISNNTNGITFDEVSAAISSDPMAQTSYREALKTNLQERLKTDPDFKSDKFPNSSKYLNK